MSSSHAGVPDVAGSYRACDTVVLFCLAFACGVLVLALAVCFRRIFAQPGYASGGSAALSSVAAGRRSSRRGGLAPSELAAIPKSTYRRGAGAGGWAQCAICLAVVPDGEVVRRLPACGHMFHVECIDLWLYSHPTCPLCRCDVGHVAAAADDKV
uniref:Uncharacterized protein n=1 Tax=Avena sativa TaxID=4498 RepID=A0ACD5ZJN5_AVESA